MYLCELLTLCRGDRLQTQEEVAKVIGDLAKELAGRAAQSNVHGRTITLRILQKREGTSTPRKFLGHGIVDAHSRSVTLRIPTAAQHDIERCEQKRFFSWTCV